MNKLVTILLITFTSLFSLEYHTYQDALKLQKTNHKPIMIDVIRDDCHYCIDMENNVLNDPQMSKYLTKKFIPVKINLDKEKLPLDLEVYFTPTFFFVNSKQEIIKKIPGSWNIKDFTDLTKNIK